MLGRINLAMMPLLLQRSWRFALVVSERLPRRLRIIAEAVIVLGSGVGWLMHSIAARTSQEGWGEVLGAEGNP